MIEVSSQDIDQAFYIWSHRIEREYPSLCHRANAELIPFSQQSQSQLKIVRRNLFLSAKSLSEKLGVSRSRYSQMEAAEVRGALTMKDLLAAAEAMNCELIYKIQPKRGKTFAQVLWDQVLPHSLEHNWLKTCDPKRKVQALAASVRRNFIDPKFRKKLGFCLNRYED